MSIKQIISNIPSDVVVGQYIQLVCLFIAASIAFVYTCGLLAGKAIHQLNDRLTAFHRLSNAERVTITKQTLTTYIHHALQS